MGQTFVELRGSLSANKEVACKSHESERKFSVHERNIAELVAPAPTPKRHIGFIDPEDKASKKAQVRREG